MGATGFAGALAAPPAAGGGGAAAGGDGAAGDGVAAGCDGAAAPAFTSLAAAAASSTAMTEPSLTLSPTFTLTSLTVPADGDGTSIVALSDSSVIRESSAFTLSPGLTKISMTGMSLKSPMSGTLTSTVVAMTLCPSDQCAAHVREQGSEIGIETRRRRPIDDAVIPGQRQRQREAP